MSQSTVLLLCLSLFFLICISAFFSAAETGLMSINRYRLRHRAKSGHKRSKRIAQLLRRPDRVLGIILIGNTFSNILASALATVLALHLYGEASIAVATLLLTFLVLLVGEVAPKTLAALYPEKTSHLTVWPLVILLKLLYPLVWLVNSIANGFLYLLHVRVGNRGHDPLTRDELRSVVHETAAGMPTKYQTMLLGILDLNKITVEDIMIPRNKIVGLNMEEPADVLHKKILSSKFNWLPIYHENFDQVAGILHLRSLLNLLDQQTFDKKTILSAAKEAYFVPEGTPLNIQLLNFQEQGRRIALVVDEYGDVQGLVTLEDILEEIVGDFTTDVVKGNKIMQQQEDGSCLVEGAITIRELKRTMNWDLPTNGPKTLSGLVVEYLESMPQAGTCVRIQGYFIEIVQVKGNRIKIAHIKPASSNE